MLIVQHKYCSKCFCQVTLVVKDPELDSLKFPFPNTCYSTHASTQVNTLTEGSSIDTRLWYSPAANFVNKNDTVHNINTDDTLKGKINSFLIK